MGARYLRWVIAAYLAVCLAVSFWLLPTGREQPPVSFAEPRRAADWDPGDPGDADALPPARARALALRQARVWQPVAPPLNLAANPPDPTGTLSEPIVRCRYLSSPTRGTTPKFDCVLSDGEVIKVKYGHTGEIHAELAASRLLTALGFGADRMYLIPRLRCYGCVRTPFYTMWALDYLRASDGVARAIPADRYSDFEWAAVERRFPGREIVAEHDEGGNADGGWGWYELDEIDGARGANRAERDALRLAALLLAHWDNKAANQRLMCLSDESPCPHPFAYIHDLGATFGPNKVNLDGWKAAPIWADRAACLVSMGTLPYGGGTFRDVRISEAGRRLLVQQLSALDDERVTALFHAARFPEFLGSDPSADVRAWTATFREKVTQIASAGPCE